MSPKQDCSSKRVKPVLVDTHVVVHIEIEEQLYSFRARRRLRPLSCPSSIATRGGTDTGCAECRWGKMGEGTV